LDLLHYRCGREMGCAVSSVVVIIMIVVKDDDEDEGDDDEVFVIWFQASKCTHASK
jgi:hypothetical protein